MSIAARPLFTLDNSYVRELEGLYEPWQAAPAPRLLMLSEELATELVVDADALGAAEGVAVLAGNAKPEGSSPVAQAYAGHRSVVSRRASAMSGRFSSSRCWTSTDAVATFT